MKQIPPLKVSASTENVKNNYLKKKKKCQHKNGPCVTRITKVGDK